MTEILKDLTGQEENLKEFREQNRIISSSPALMLEVERLISDVEVLNQVYITLRTEHELANIEEVENSKTIKVETILIENYIGGYEVYEAMISDHRPVMFSIPFTDLSKN